MVLTFLMILVSHHLQINKTTKNTAVLEKVKLKTGDARIAPKCLEL